MHHRAVDDLEPARSRRFADNDLGDVVGVSVGENVVGKAPVAARDGGGITAERMREAQRIGNTVAFFFAQADGAPGFDRQCDERRVQVVGHPLGVAHQAGGARVLADTDQDTLARGPGSGNRPRLHLREELVVDPVRGAPQRQFAQRGQVLR